MIVKLAKPQPDYPDLTPSRTYAVIGIEANDLRLLNDQGQPYLYQRDLFEIIDAHAPTDWLTEVGDEGEPYAYPCALNAPGFFEDFFDGNATAVATFWQEVNQRLALAMAA